MNYVVYVALDLNMQPLYVGSTTNLPSRLTWHQDESPWFVDCYRLCQFEQPDKATMLAEERRLIALHNPPWNWLSRSIPNPRPKPTRAECQELLAARPDGWTSPDTRASIAAVTGGSGRARDDRRGGLRPDASR